MKRLLLLLLLLLPLTILSACGKSGRPEKELTTVHFRNPGESGQISYEAYTHTGEFWCSKCQRIYTSEVRKIKYNETTRTVTLTDSRNCECRRTTKKIKIDDYTICILIYKLTYEEAK